MAPPPQMELTELTIGTEIANDAPGRNRPGGSGSGANGANGTNGNGTNGTNGTD
jgi:hypothetical protein